MFSLFKGKTEEKPLTTEQRVAELGLTALVDEEMAGKKNMDVTRALTNLFISRKINAEQYRICVLTDSDAGLGLENIMYKYHFPKRQLGEGFFRYWADRLTF